MFNNSEHHQGKIDIKYNFHAPLSTDKNTKDDMQNVILDWRMAFMLYRFTTQFIFILATELMKVIN